MRRTKTGAIHAHSASIQHQKGEPVDPRQVLANWMRSTPEMMRIWGQQWEGTEAKTVRAAIRDYLERLEES